MNIRTAEVREDLKEPDTDVFTYFENSEIIK